MYVRRLAGLLDKSGLTESSPPKEDSTVSRQSSSSSLPPRSAPETCVFCMLPKRDCIATQDTLYFQYFLADWADKVMALCTTVRGLCGIVHQLMLAFYVRSKGQGGVAWDTRHQGLEGGVAGFVPQGLLSQIISGQLFPV